MPKRLILHEKIYILKAAVATERGYNGMKVNIYYGGRGLLDDPTLYVLGKMEEVLRELRVSIERINIYEHKNEIATLPQTMKDADGIILATTVEWLGIGGYMQQFLDSCWLYGDKEKIQTTYMQPIVMSTTYGEREGEVTLQMHGRFWADFHVQDYAAMWRIWQSLSRIRILPLSLKRRRKTFIARFHRS